MKRITMLAVLVFAIGSAGVSHAQSAREVVSPKVTPETGRMMSDNVSDAAKDAMKKEKKEKKAKEMKDSADMKTKVKDAEDAMKKKMK